MSRRADGLHKPVVILAGVFANRLLSTVEQRFAVRLVGDEFIDCDNVDFTNVSLAIVFASIWGICLRDGMDYQQSYSMMR